MSNQLGTIKKDYTTALRHFLSEPEELDLVRAYELGRGALASGLGVIDIATVHCHAMSAVLERPLADAERAHVLRAQMDFFVEALSPFEMAHRAFREANTVLRRLSETLEAQAKRIAYSLHDEAGQLLASAHFVIAEVSSRLSAENAKELQQVQALLHELEARLHNISHELRPPVLEEIGLHRALELLGESVAKRWGLPVNIKTSLIAEMHPTVETAVYRVTQEALTNAARHASANRAVVEVRQSQQKIFLSVRDDGIGLPASSRMRRKGRPGLGLVGIKERVDALGGAFQVRPNKPRGTDLRVEIPLED